MSQGKVITYIDVDELPAATPATGDRTPFWDSSENRWSYAAPSTGAFTAITATSLQGDSDTNTKLVFTDDAISFQAGGVTFFDLTEAGQDVLTWNAGAVDIDFTANKLTAGSWLTYDGGTDVLTLGSATMAVTPITTFAAINRYKSTNAITAFAGGGQASATAIASALNTITTCATAADSVKLPASVVGLRIHIANQGAAYASVFPASGEVIDALAANASISCPANSTLTFICTVVGTWTSSPVLIPSGKFTTNTTTVTFAAGQLTGADTVVYHNTGSTPGSIATRTASLMFTDDPTARVGYTYICRIVNAQGTGTLTVTAGSGVTLTGTATIALNTYRDFSITYTSASALVMQNLCTGTFS